MDIDPESGKIWVGDVGWARVEEITVVEAGTNHGWHLFEGSECRASGETGVTEEDCDDARDEMIFPVHEYLHPGNGCAVIGGYVYRGHSYPVATRRLHIWRFLHVQNLGIDACRRIRVGVSAHIDCGTTSADHFLRHRRRRRDLRSHRRWSDSEDRWRVGCSRLTLRVFA